MKLLKIFLIPCITASLTACLSQTSTSEATSSGAANGGSVQTNAATQVIEQINLDSRTGTASSTSTISASGPVLADGKASSVVTITLLNSYGKPVVGTVPKITVSGTGNLLTACSSSNTSGVSTCSFASTVAETKTVTLTSPITKSGINVLFKAGAPDSNKSLFSASGPVIANGTSTSTVSITIYDSNLNAISGIIPTFSTSGTGNSQSACSVSNSSGKSTCTLTSTVPETKTLSVLTPFSKTGVSVVFSVGPASELTSTISATGPVVANGTSTSVVSIKLKDGSNNAISGIVPTFSVSGSNNTLTTCSASNSLGESSCSFTSTSAETKNIALVSPVAKPGGSVVFSAVVVADSGGTKTPADLSVPSAMYVYDYDNAVMGTLAERDQILTFAQNNSIKEIYLSADQYFTSPSKQPNLTAFITAAKTKYNIDTTLLFSNYDWALVANHGACLTRAQDALNYIASLPAGSVKPLRLQFDIEPHVLSTWNSDMQNVANQYLDLISSLAAMTKDIIPLQMVTSFIYNNKAIVRPLNSANAARPLSELIIDGINSTDSIMIMNYRDNIPYDKVVSSGGVLKKQTFSNQVLGTSTAQYVTNDILYASTKGKSVYQSFNAKCKVAADFGVTEQNCTDVLSLNAAAYTAYGSACNSYFDYKASSFCEEGKVGTTAIPGLLKVGTLLQQTYGTNTIYSGFKGWGVFSYMYFNALK